MEKPATDRRIKEFISRVKDNFSIEKISNVGPGDLAAFNMEAYRDAFNARHFENEKKIARLWKWLYGDNPASEGTANSGWSVRFKGKLIGQLRMLPSLIKIGSAYYKAGWGTGLVVLDEYRNLGIGALLIQKAKEEGRDDFDLFTVGGMNPNSYRLFKEEGLIDLVGIPRYVKILKKGVFSKLFGTMGKTRIPIPESVKGVEIIKSFDEEFNVFWNSVSMHYGCIAKRDRKFLKWRYENQLLWPYVIFKVKDNIRMKGFAVVREGEVKSGLLKGRKIGIITDILLDPRDKVSSKRLLGAVMKFFNDKNIALIKCDVLSANIEGALKRSGFFGIKAIAHRFMLYVYADRLARKDADRAVVKENWHVTSGDSDLDFD